MRTEIDPPSLRGYCRTSQREARELFIFLLTPGLPRLPQLLWDTCDQVLGPELVAGGQPEPTVAGGYACLHS